MADFSVTEAALTGFRIVRERPKVLIAWALLQLVLAFGLSYPMVTFFGVPLTHLETMSAAPAPPDPTQMIALARELLPPFGCLLLFSLIVSPVLYAAMNRAVLQPSDDRVGYLRLGGDELRQLGLLLQFLALALAVDLGLTLATTLVGSAVSLVFGGRVELEALVVLLSYVLLVLAWVFLGVRFSLAPAQTFATRRINLLGSWSLTRERFWRLLRTYLLAFALFAIVTLLTGVVMQAAEALIGSVSHLPPISAHSDYSSASAYFSPARVVDLVLGSLFGALTLPLLLTPSATIYQALAADEPSV